MSPSSRLISAGLPAPSQITTSNRARRSARASSTSGISARLDSWYSAAVCTPVARPITTTWLARSLVGLSSTGFIAASGGTPAATAWTHWAWPISAPSAVTDALSAMFCALNGATRTPRRARSRQSPATTNDLPASLVVPHTSSDPSQGRRQRHHYCRPPWHAPSRSSS